jgi:hypothetical protein
VVEKIEPATVVNALISNAVKQKLIDQPDPGAEGENKDDWLEALLAARDYAKQSIEEGLTGN